MTIKVLAYLIIPVYTIAFTGGYNWFTTNFSVIGNLMDKKLAFLIWGIVVGLYFYLIYRRLRPLVRLRPPVLPAHPRRPGPVVLRHHNALPAG